MACLFALNACMYVYRLVFPFSSISKNRIQIKTKYKIFMLFLDHFMFFPIVLLFLLF